MIHGLLRLASLNDRPVVLATGVHLLPDLNLSSVSALSINMQTCLSFPIRHILSVSHKKKMERIILSQNIWYFPLDAVMVLNYRYRISDHRTDHEISFPLNF